jgi:hypothetical protein
VRAGITAACAAAAAVSAAALLAGCAPGAPAAAGGPRHPAGATRPGAAAAGAISMATSLTTARGAWAIVPMASDPAFWQVFSRPANSGNWELATPPGVASNGGIVAAGDGSSVTVAVRPSQALTFTPLAASSGGQWTPGLLDAAIAPSPDALAADGPDLAAVLTDKAIMESTDDGAAWHVLASATAITSSPAGKRCGLESVTAVAFGMKGTVLAAGTCTGAGTGLFSYRGGRWQPDPLPAAGQVAWLAGGTALVRQGSRLTAVRDTPSGWQASAPLPGGGTAAGSVTAAGLLAGQAAWVILPGGYAAVTSGTAWRVLPRVPAGTAVLAAGPDGAIDALAVSGSELDVWRLPGGKHPAPAWQRAQAISVPIQYGSSS